MGIFHDQESREEYEAIKNEYRWVKEELVNWQREDYPSIGAHFADKAPKFEYLVLEDIEEAVLDEKGANGWELVNFATYAVGFGLGGNERYKVHMRYVFKRPVVGLPPELAPSFDRLRELRQKKAELVAEIEARGDIAE